MLGKKRSTINSSYVESTLAVPTQWHKFHLCYFTIILHTAPQNIACTDTARRTQTNPNSPAGPKMARSTQFWHQVQQYLCILSLVWSFSNFLPWRNLYNNRVYPENSCPGGGGDYKEIVVSARRLLQYLQLPDKTHAILRGMFIISCGISK